LKNVEVIDFLTCPPADFKKCSS